MLLSLFFCSASFLSFLFALCLLHFIELLFCWFTLYFDGFSYKSSE